MAAQDTEAPSYEDEHVHAVYDQIATHFSSTRYKPWPIVEQFLRNLPPGSIGLDVGCGNGKYLAVNRDVFIVGSDRSPNLVAIASRHGPHTAVIADTLSLPHQHSTFDFAISIAVIHHLSTPNRRIFAIKAILKILKPPESQSQSQSTTRDRHHTGNLKQHQTGHALIFVWALEQSSSRRGWTKDSSQDVMVPWVMKRGQGPLGSSMSGDQTFNRYYHLYREGELEENVREAGGVIVERGYERDNWWVVIRRGREERGEDGGVGGGVKSERGDGGSR